MGKCKMMKIKKRSNVKKQHVTWRTKTKKRPKQEKTNEEELNSIGTVKKNSNQSACHLSCRISLAIRLFLYGILLQTSATKIHMFQWTLEKTQCKGSFKIHQYRWIHCGAR